MSERVSDEDEQVKQLLHQKGAFSGLALKNVVCGTRIGNASVTLHAQKMQLAIDAAKMHCNLEIEPIGEQSL